MPDEELGLGSDHFLPERTDVNVEMTARIGFDFGMRRPASGFKSEARRCYEVLLTNDIKNGNP
jgi:hypothetical protein